MLHLIQKKEDETSTSTLHDTILPMYVLTPYIANEVYYIAGVNNVSTMIYSILIAMMLLMALCRIDHYLKKCDVVYPILFASMIMILLFRKPYYSSVSLQQVAVFILVPFLLFADEHDALTTLRWFLRFSVLLLPTSILLMNTKDEALRMTFSYALATPAVAAIMLYRCDDTRKRIMDKALVGIGFYYFIMLLLFGKRGPVLVVLVGMILSYVKVRNNSGKLTTRQILRLLALVLAVIFAVNNYVLILEYILSVTRRLFGIEATSIIRTLTLSSSEYSIDSGRANLYKEAWRQFSESPVIGHGLGSFYYMYSNGITVTYPHNLLLELLDDGGIVFMLATILPISACFIKSLYSSQYYPSILYLFLFSIAIPHFLVSTSIYDQPDVWCLLCCSHYLMSQRSFVS